MFPKSLFADVKFVFVLSVVYSGAAILFSLLGLLLEPRSFLDNPLTGGLDFEHIAGHIVWGLLVGAASLKFRYFLLGGSLAILLDSDHLIQFLPVEAIGRMGHSFMFGIVSSILIVYLFRNKGRPNYRLTAVVFGALFAHLSFDILTGGGNFPIFAPFSGEIIRFANIHFILFEVIAILSVLIAFRIRKYC